VVCYLSEPSRTALHEFSDNRAPEPLTKWLWAFLHDGPYPDINSFDCTTWTTAELQRCEAAATTARAELGVWVGTKDAVTLLGMIVAKLGAEIQRR